MQGMFFVHIGPDPKVAGRMLIKSGVVKAAVGVGRWLLQFKGNGYDFANVLSAEALESFVFFNAPSERDAFIAELLASNQLQAPPQIPLTPPITEEIPLIDEAP